MQSLWFLHIIKIWPLIALEQPHENRPEHDHFCINWVFLFKMLQVGLSCYELLHPYTLSLMHSPAIKPHSLLASKKKTKTKTKKPSVEENNLSILKWSFINNKFFCCSVESLLCICEWRSKQYKLLVVLWMYYQNNSLTPSLNKILCSY